MYEIRDYTTMTYAKVTVLLSVTFEGNRSSNRYSYSFLSRSKGLDHAEGAPTRFMVASGGVLSEGYGHGGLGVCLGDDQTEAYLKDTGMAGLASVWAMARRRPYEYRRKVDAATPCSGVCLHT